MLVFEDNVLRLLCGYTPLSEMNFDEKQTFSDELKGDWDMHSVGDLVMCFDDLYEHMGRDIDGSYGVHGMYSVGESCFVGSVLLILSEEGIMCQIYGKRERRKGR